MQHMYVPFLKVCKPSAELSYRVMIPRMAMGNTSLPKSVNSSAECYNVQYPIFVLKNEYYIHVPLELESNVLSP